MRNDIKRFFVAALAACGLAVSAALAAPSYQAKLTVQGYAEDSETLADFPVLVRLSPQTVDGFDYDACQADGSDVVFVDEIGEPLAYQLDTWNPSGESLFWVKLPQLAKDKSFHVRWGDSVPNVDPERSAATWNANYAGVWHMGEADGVCSNSTSHGSAYDATPMGATSESVRYDGDDAPVGDARTTAKSSKAYLSVPSTDAFQHDGVFTISGWVRCEAGSGYFRLFSRKNDYQGTGWEAESQNGNMTQFTARGDKNDKILNFSLSSPGLLKNWVHLAFVYNQETLSVYGNGARIAQGTINPAKDNDLPFSIGCDSDGSEAFVRGAFDECRLMGGAASADWVKAEYDTAANRDFLAYDVAESLAPDPTLRLTAFRSSAVADASADFMAYVSGLGEGAASATLTLAYGFDAASLGRTQEVGRIDRAGRAEFRLSRLQPGRTYFVRLVVRNNLDQSLESDVLRVKTAVVPDGFGEPGLNQTFFTQANANWGKSYAELPQGTDWRKYEDGNRIYRRELGVLAAYLGGNPTTTKRTSEVWGDEVYWPANGGQWVYWGQMRLEGGKSYRFRTHIDDNERVQITDPSTGKTTTLLEDVSNNGNIVTSPSSFVPPETGWYPIEIRLSDGSGGAGGYTTTDDYLNTQNMGWSDDDGATWKLMMDPGDGSLFLADGRASVSVKEVISDGALQGLTLTFPPADKNRDLYLAWGPVHGGNTLAGWANTNFVATIAAGQTDATSPLPPNWGSADSLVLRFCLLDGARPVWSPSVYWRDVADPDVSLDALDGRMGDTLKVTGDLKGYAGGPCTLKVLVGPSEDEMTQEWTGLDSSVRPSPGAFELTLFLADKTSPKYLAPGETYFVCIEAEAGGRRTRSQVMQVTMARDPEFDSVSAAVERRTVTFSGRLTDVGMGDVATVSLWVGETNDAETFVRAGDPLDVQGGAFSFTHTFNDWERTYYWQFRAVSTSAGGTATAETRTAVASCKTTDSATYTWNGGADGDWENSANWTNNGGDAFGYPNGEQTTVTFPAYTKARIVLRGEMSVGTLNLTAAGIEVTFARAAGQEAEDAKPKLLVKNQPNLSGAWLRLALDGVALQSPGTSLTAFDGEVRLSNGASWDLGSLSNDNGGRLWLGKGTSLTCADYVFGGGLTVIDDATLKVTSCVVLGSGKLGGKIRFVGTQPAFLCSAQNAMVRSGLETANVRLEFALPVGGYQEPPFVNTSGKQPSYILGYNGNQKREWPITVDIAPDSPGAFDLQTTNTTLISWGKGICSNIIQTAVQPGANATFVWSKENEDGNPVSLGVRLVSSYTNELHVTGSPEEVIGDGLEPGYGVSTVPLGESIECKAPAGTFYLSESETKRATCVGWKLYSVDAETRTRTLVDEGAGTSCNYTNTNGLWHELVWQWKVEYLVKATTDGNGTAFVKSESVESASVESAWVETGKKARVTVTPDEGYWFGKWTGDVPADHDKDQPLTFTVRDQAYAFTASFLPVVYVSPSGDDVNNDGKSLDTPFQTIKKALASDSPVCALLADGTYEVTEQIALTNGSTVAGATPGARAVVKLMKPLSDREAPGSVFKLAHADARLYNLTVTTDYDRGDASQNAYGAARNGGFGRGVWIEQAGLVDGCVITNCRSLYCNGSGGGGVYLKKGGIVRRTLLTHNSTYGPNNDFAAAKGHNAMLDGGGLVESCRLVWGGGGETSLTRCGGVYSYGGTVRNSLVAYNTQVYDNATSGIAVHLIDGVMENCTVAGNFHLTSRRTPAVYAHNNDNSWTNDPVIRNCVIWGNTGAGADANWGLEPGRCVVSNTCALPRMPGEGNIDADPGFANPGGDFRLTLSSAVDAAVPLDWMDWTGDLDGNDRQQGAAPDMGCYEFEPSAFSCGFDVSAGGALDRDDITLTARVAGDDLEGLSYEWTLTNERGFTMVTNTTDASLTLPLTSGLYTIDLSVKKGEAVVGTVTRQDVVRVNQKDFYVAENGADEYPYDTVAKGAQDINTVLALAVDGAVIHVEPGWYRPADGLTVVKGVTIVANGGPEQTFLFAPMTTANQAMVTVAHAGAVLSGLTVTGKDENGNQPEQWGGLRVTAGVVTNCVISHHKTKKDSVRGAGCRLEGGTVVDCTFTNNFCTFVGNASTYGVGGAVTLEVGDALLDRCTVVSNRIANANGAVTGDSYAYGGGVYLAVGTVRNTLVVGNESHAYCGGIAVEGTGRVLNCTVVGNKARLGSGGIWQGDGGTVRDCLCLGNVAHGVVDSADDPGFVDAANGDYRLNPASAAVDAADGADLGDCDLAGRPRVSGAQADKGCYERQVSQTDYGISFRKLTPFAPGEVEFSAKAANGTLSDCLWTFDGSEQMTGATVTNLVRAPGSVSVSFSANLNGEQVVVNRPNWFVAYGETVHVVVSNENPVFPYATWETAATNLNDAFAAVQRNGTILMGEGTYLLTDERTIDFPMTLRGANGPERTVLDAQAKLRPFQLWHPSAVLDGLTLRNGQGGSDRVAGGVAIRGGGQVTNCVFAACFADSNSAAGVGVEGCGARILDCRFEGCWVDYFWSLVTRQGVAINASGNNGGEEDLLIDRCLVRGSYETRKACGDGAIRIKNGTVRNTIVTGSVLRGCGGIVADGTAKVENCTIVGNLCTNETETVAGLYVADTNVKVYNTIVWDNRWTNGVNSAVKDVGGTGNYASCLENCWTAGDPKLRGSGKFAFRPTSGSPCINAGSRLPWMDETAVDVYGCPRVRGRNPDIGAAEFSSAGFKILVR